MGYRFCIDLFDLSPFGNFTIAVLTLVFQDQNSSKRIYSNIDDSIGSVIIKLPEVNDLVVIIFFLTIIKTEIQKK